MSTLDLEIAAPECDALIEELGTSPRLLVGSDFDGTLAPFTVNPQDSQIDQVARVALRALSELPNTFVAVISGRSLADLAPRFQQLEKVRLVGSHGHEFDIDRVSTLSQELRDLLQRGSDIIQETVERCPGTRMESKPHGVVFHYRGLDLPPSAALKRLEGSLKALGQGVVCAGNMILEYCVVSTDKGNALARIREQLCPNVTLFIGDDVTDESAFKQISPQDVSIKVGIGDTAARFRLGSSETAIEFLARLAECRSNWMRALPGVPIGKHIFLSDLRTTALVDHFGTVSWMCVPRLDGAPLFGALVGGPGAGHFRASGGGEGVQDYLENSLVGRTTFGPVSVTDFFDCSAGRTFQRAGRSDLVRLLEGRGEMSLEFAPKLDFGRVPTRLWGVEEGLRIECGQQKLVLVSPNIGWQITREGMHDVARARFALKDECLALVLLAGTASGVAPERSMSRIMHETQRFWLSWLATLKLPQQNSKLVARSALTLRALSYGPTGAITAAATTSLPETFGGSRNWDYRFCWPRDACLSASALLKLNAPGPAMRLLDWILGIVFDEEESQQFLAPLYTVTGRAVPGEAEVVEALGYRSSRPVRIGNLAYHQLQLDTLAPIAELMRNLARRGASLTSEHLQLADRLVALVESRWQDADSGIWEMRGPQRHFVHSKLMCWYTVTCCRDVARYLGSQREDWEQLAALIRGQVETKGFDEALQSYVAAYDLRRADAALLWIVLSGFHPPEHPRSLGTLHYIMGELLHDGCMFRYHFDDALHGQEGEFILCRCWLIETLALCGRKAEAQQLLQEMISRIGPLGILAEQWDVAQKCDSGNYPQAYSHLGLINCLCALESV